MSDPNPILDFAVIADLRESVNGDESFIRELVGAYLAESPTYLETMETAAAGGDAAALVRPAHTLKSSSAAIGAMHLSALSKRIELAAREGNVDSDSVAAASALWPETVAALRTAGLTE